MNERIQELAAEAYRRVNPGPDPYGEADAAWMGFGELEKVFAELIVRECIQAVKNVGGYNEDYHMNAIKKYFGVES
jgi:hypothetical protein